MKRNAFASCHPAVCFLFLAGAIGFGVVIQHPGYLLASFLGAASCYLLLKGRKGLSFLLGMLPLAALLAVINPVFNTQGSHILFRLWGRPYTLEALCYGLTLAGMFLVMMLWFGCYHEIITSDKFICLFGSLIPALSLLLVMVLRMIPSLTRKTRQIMGARNSIGRGAAELDSPKQKVIHGMAILSALTDWALEGSVITADSMRARGYGTGKHTSFQIYRFTRRDRLLLALIPALAAAVILLGGTHATFTPVFQIPPLSWGFAAYCIYLAIPTVLEIKEAITWHILRSKI